MADHSPDLSQAEPLEIVERPDDPSTDPFEIEFTAYPAPGAGADGPELSHERWVADLSEEHVNPKWDEWYEVLAGEYRIATEGTETTLTAGDDVVLPANVPHRHWNPSDRPARVRFEARPGRRGLAAIETLYTLAQAGRVGDDGLPNLLQFAVIQDEYPGLFFSTDLPRSVQRPMFSVLAPIGRRLGYRPFHARDEIDELR